MTLPDPVSELSSLDEADEEDDARTETTNGIDRWNRVRELASQLSSTSTASRVRQKISLLNAIAQHVAAANGPPPESIFQELSEIYTRCAEALPERHRPLLASPLQTLRFALRERVVPPWFIARLSELETAVAGGSTVAPIDPLAAQPASVGEESLDLEDFSIPKSRFARPEPTASGAARYDPISAEAKLAYVESCGCSSNLYQLMAKIQSGRIPFNETASSFLREVAWMESVQSWQDWNANRAYQLAQLANRLCADTAAPPSLPGAAPTILPAPEKYQTYDGDSSRKVRRLETHGARPFQTTAGVVVVHPVARGGPGGRHAGVSGTMWDNPVIRKLLRLDEVQLLYDLRDFCLENGGGSGGLLADVGAAGPEVVLPRLEGVPEPTNLASHFPVHATGSSKFSSARQDLMCSLCGLVLQTQAIKRTHIKSHLIRASAVLPQLLGSASKVTTGLAPLRAWQEVHRQANGVAAPFNGTKARAAAEVLDQLMTRKLGFDHQLYAHLHALDDGGSQEGGEAAAPQLLEQLPLKTTLACSSLHHAALVCVVCNACLRPTHVDGQWLLQDVLVGQLHRSNLRLSVWQPWALGAGQSTRRRKDLESIVAGPANCAFRKCVGKAYGAARDRNERCPDELKTFLSRLVKAIDGDLNKLQVLTQAFSREAQRKILQTTADEGENSSSMLKGCLRAFEYYLDRFASSQVVAAHTDEEDMLEASQPGNNGGAPPSSLASGDGSQIAQQQKQQPPGSILIPLALADAEFLHTRFGQGQLLLHASCVSPFVISTSISTSS